MPLTVNCTCGKVFKVKDEMAGRVVTCQVCGNTLTAPQVVAAPPIAPSFSGYEQPPSPARVIPATMTCPACAEEIPENARICPQCGELISKVLSKEDQAALLETVLQKLDAHLKNPAAQAEDQRIQGGFFSIKTIIAGTITALAVASVVAGIGMGSRDGTGFVVLGVMGGLISGICVLVSLVNDFKASNIGSASQPGVACGNFFSAVKTGRAKKAFVALAPSARTTGSVKSIQFKDKKIPAHSGLYSIMDVSSFARYWKSVFTGPSGQSRTVQVKIKGVRTIAQDTAVVDAEFTIANYPSWIIITVLLNLILCVILILIIQRKEKQIIRKLLIRRNGNWYIAGDFPVHHYWLGQNKWGLENVANLGQLPPSGATIVVGSPKIAGCTGGPSRVMAFL